MGKSSVFWIDSIHKKYKLNIYNVISSDYNKNGIQEKQLYVLFLFKACSRNLVVREQNL